MKKIMIKTSEVKVEKRVRTEFGSIKTLAQEIQKTKGLLQPIVISEDFKLINGERRLKAYIWLHENDSEKKNGQWLKIPAVIKSFETAREELQAELIENKARKGFTAAELSEIKNRLELTVDETAAETGTSRKTVSQSNQIMKAESPVKEVQDKMDDLKKRAEAGEPVERLHKELVQIQTEAGMRKPKELTPDMVYSKIINQFHDLIQELDKPGQKELLDLMTDYILLDPVTE